ncbi:MAG: AbrB/MazE/SpoVT family DNA-binding domain-containing protein [Candidatus Zipacnadales bacterium]
MPLEPKYMDEMFIGAVTVGERGQIVIPAEAREAYNIQGGDKLLVFHHPGHCGLTIVRVQDVQNLFDSVAKIMEKIEHLATDTGESPSDGS